MRQLLSLPAVLLFCASLTADPGKEFSKLSEDAQQSIRHACAAPALSARRGPYSTPMYYLMVKGYGYEGKLDVGPNDRTYPSMNGKTGPDWGFWVTDRNRPDWQEAMVKNWAELGLNNTHLNLYPMEGKLTLDSDYTQGIKDFVSLSEKYGLRVGVRLDSLDETKLWTMHPNNPENQRKAYLGWVEEVATLLKGQTAYYVLGDELTLKKASPDLPKDAWTAPMYLEYFKEVSAVIKRVDPSAKVCMFGASSGEWFNVLWLLENGYADAGDGVAINHYDYNTVPKFFADRDRLAPGKMFLTNGVGYISAGTVKDRYPQGDAYSPMPTEEAHAAAIAKTMFMWWDLGADTAPYYISLRNWVMEGKTYPRWFGFFGFEDFVVQNDQLAVKRYPGWYAYQAVANTFYNRDEFRKPSFEVSSSAPISKLSAFERKVEGGSELLLMVWNDDGGEKQTTITIASEQYKYPVSVSLADMTKWESLESDVSGGKTSLKLTVGNRPQIIRLTSGIVK